MVFDVDSYGDDYNRSVAMLLCLSQEYSYRSDKRLGFAHLVCWLVSGAGGLTRFCLEGPLNELTRRE